MNTKISCIVSAPPDTYSGYGRRSVDFIKALIESQPDWDIKILSQRWGTTRFGYLKDHGEEELISRIIPNIIQKPDVWIQISVPNEFQKMGKYNIGVTAGIETTLCDPSWLEGCNRMELVLVSSEHAKKIFTGTKYNVEDSHTKQVTGTIELKTKIEVLFEGIDTKTYLPVTSPSNFNLEQVSENFCFLVCGHWLQGELGQDRKNIGFTIKSFLETFKNKQKQPAMIVKVQIGAGTSIIDREMVLDRIDSIRKTVKGNLPNIYLIHGELTDAEMNELYNHTKVKAMVSLTKGEGFGRPLLEFSMVNKPIIVSNWSGPLDFLDKDFVRFVNGTLTQVHASAVVDKMILANSGWFSVDPVDTGRAYRDIFDDYEKWVNKAKRQGHKSRTNYSYDHMGITLKTMLDTHIPEFPRQIKLNLPSLNKIKLPSLTKIK